MSSIADPARGGGGELEFEFFEQHDRRLAELLADSYTESHTSQFFSQFDHDAQAYGIKVGGIAVHTLQEFESKIDAERQGLLDALNNEHQEILRKIASARTARQLEINDAADAKVKQYDRMYAELERQHKINVANLKRNIDHARGEISNEIARQQGELKEFGRVRPIKAIRMRSSRSFQAARVTLRHIRSVRDRIPVGDYCIAVSKFSAVGGNLLPFDERLPFRKDATNPNLAGVVPPFRYSGSAKEETMEVKRSVAFASRPPLLISPTEVYVFELILIAPLPRTLAWGVFPVCDVSGRIACGDFKVPLLKGPVNKTIHLFHKVTRVWRKDINAWLGNLYFSVGRLPADTLEPPDQRGNNVGRGIKLTEVFLRELHGVRLMPADIYKSINKNMARRLTGAPGGGAGGGDSSGDDSSSSSAAALPESEDAPRSFRLPLSASDSYTRHTASEHTSDVPRFLNESDLSSISGPSPMGTTPAEPTRATSARAEPEMRRIDAPEVDFASNKERQNFLTAVPIPVDSKGQRDSSHYIRFILRFGLGYELAFLRPLSRQFIMMLVMSFVVFALSLVLHYGAQFLLLRAVGAPYQSFLISLFRAHLTYESRIIPLLSEIGILMAGPAAVFAAALVVAALLHGTSLLMRRRKGATVPTALWVFTEIVFIFAVLDPFITLARDLTIGRANGDAMRLYNWFLYTWNSGAWGIVLTVVLYLLLVIVFALVFVAYLLFVHSEGITKDTLARVCSSSNAVYAPEDEELSVWELAKACRDANKFRGPRGERRRIIIERIELTNEESGAVEDTLDYIGIFTVQKSGVRTEHRQFLKHSSGAITEVFGVHPAIVSILNETPGGRA